jgi:hypothetical protein
MENVQRKAGRPPKRHESVEEQNIISSHETVEKPFFEQIEEIDKDLAHANNKSEDAVSEDNSSELSSPHAVSNAEPDKSVVGRINTEIHDAIKIPDGYSSIESAPHNGIPITVSDGKNTANVTWRKTRAFANATHRWEETGLWSDELSGQKITFVPLFWKHRERRR